MLAMGNVFQEGLNIRAWCLNGRSPDIPRGRADGRCGIAQPAANPHDAITMVKDTIARDTLTPSPSAHENPASLQKGFNHFRAANTRTVQHIRARVGLGRGRRGAGVNFGDGVGFAARYDRNEATSQMQRFRT